MRFCRQVFPLFSMVGRTVQSSRAARCPPLRVRIRRQSTLAWRTVNRAANKAPPLPVVLAEPQEGYAAIRRKATLRRRAASTSETPAGGSPAGPFLPAVLARGSVPRSRLAETALNERRPVRVRQGGPLRAVLTSLDGPARTSASPCA